MFARFFGAGLRWGAIDRDVAAHRTLYRITHAFMEKAGLEKCNFTALHSVEVAVRNVYISRLNPLNAEIHQLPGEKNSREAPTGRCDSMNVA